MKQKANPILHLVSNMYPSPENVRYGIFVKNFEEAVQDNFTVQKVVLIKKHGFLSKLGGYFFLYVNILKLLAKGSQDLIYVHFPLHVAPALWLLSFFRKRIILNFHGSDLIFDSFFKKVLALFLPRLVKKAQIVVPSNYYKEKVIQIYSTAEYRVLVYPSGGINTAVFYPDKSNDKKHFTVGFVSNFIEEKGWLIFLEALLDIKERNLIPNVQIIMVGDGPDAKKIKDFLSINELSVTLLSNLTQIELAEKYNELDLFVFPTYREAESLGLVGLEAMACGVPVIASKVGGPMGYVKEGKNGYLFNIKDVSMLVEKISLFYNLNNEVKKHFCENAVKTAKKYDYTIVQKELLAFLY